MARNHRYWGGWIVRSLLLSLLVFPFVQAQDSYAQGKQPAVVWPTIALTALPIQSGDLIAPVYLTNAGDGSGRLFIVEQDGRVRIFQNGSLQAAPFLDIKSEVLSPADSGGGGEQGLLSIAFPPNYTSKGYFYVYYTQLDGNNTVSRFHITSQDQADPKSEQHILTIPHPNFQNHNGGQLAFGPDGYLYIGTGDGGSGGDPNNNAQNPGVLLGKLLRIDTEPGSVPTTANQFVYLPILFSNSQAFAQAYRIPADNPFIDRLGYRGEIWALGLRNPWRFSFDRQTGALYIGDVGQASWEEIDYQPPIAQGGGGENYGWRIMEGLHCYNSLTCNQTGLTLPIYEYANTHKPCTAVTGGYVYRGSAYPSLDGIYIFTDFCTGVIQGLIKDNGVWQNHDFNLTQIHISSFGVDEAGELYAVNRDGAIYRITVP